MQTLNAFMIRYLLAPAPGRSAFAGVLVVLAAIAACELRTMGMGVQRSDGRNAGIADPVLMHVAETLRIAITLV